MNDSKAEGVFDELKGKIKQGFGEATNNQSIANEGAADQVKGHAEETWGNVKDTAHNIGHSNQTTDTRLHAESDAHNTRNSIVDGAEHLKDSIKHGLDNLEHKANR